MTKRAFLITLAAAAVLLLPSPGGAQIRFEDAVAQLNAANAVDRLRAVQLLKEAAFPEAAVPLVAALTDADDDVQFEAIAAELNIFLAEKVSGTRHVGLVVEVRNRISAAAVFASGDAALLPAPVPADVLRGLWAASRDSNERVAIEALYAFGALSGGSPAADRAQTLAAIAPDLAASVGVHDPLHRLAAVRVIARVYGRPAAAREIPETVGDAVIVALNDREADVKSAAMQALGAMKYERGVQALTDLFQFYGRGPLADAALAALARIGHASSEPLFVAQLTGRNPAMKASAIEGLARMNARAHAQDIMAALQAERSEPVLLAGQFAAVKLANGPIDRIADALLQPRLHDQALGYLVEVAYGRASSFVRHAQDPDERMRLDVANTLGLSGDPEALAVVEPLLKDHDPRVAAAAARAVARLRAGSRAATW